MIVEYKYWFSGWDNFVTWLKAHDFTRYEKTIPCWRCYHRDYIIIEVSYHTDIPNRILKFTDNFWGDRQCILEFFDPNEIPQNILKEFVR